MANFTTNLKGITNKCRYKETSINMLAIKVSVRSVIITDYASNKILNYSYL
jgi:hypothetical protein